MKRFFSFEQTPLANLNNQIYMSLCKSEHLRLLNLIDIWYIYKEKNPKINSENGSPI